MLLGFCVEHGAEKEGHRGQWRRWRNHYLRVFQCAVLSVEAHGAIVVDDVFELAPADIGARVVGTAPVRVATDGYTMPTDKKRWAYVG